MFLLISFLRLNRIKLFFMSNDQQPTEKKDKPCGCSDAMSTSEINENCKAPLPMPLADCGNCMKWFITNIINKQGYINSQEPNIQRETSVTIQFEVVYEFSLCLKGKQPGKLLYTTSLIPQEELKIYISDRLRKTTDASACFSVHSTFRSSVSALHESMQSGSIASYSDNLKKNNSSSGESGGFLGLFSGNSSQSNSSSNENIQSLQSASQNFQQTLVAASQSVEAQRSLVVSSYEDHENLQVTNRTLKNYNNCYAVTYYIRQVNEVYEFTAKIFSIRWRIVESRLNNVISDWQTPEDVDKIQNDEVKKLVETFIDQIEKGENEIRSERCFTLPTDGTILETELAYCSSCDGERMMELEVILEKTKAETNRLMAETELMRLEIERRKKLLEAGDFNLFDQPVTNS